MCLFSTPSMAAPQAPQQYAAQRTPTEKDASVAGKRMRDRMRARSSTLLTGSAGTGAADMAGKKVLLGQ